MQLNFRTEKEIGLGLLLALVIVQFARPTKNSITSERANEISKFYDVPAEVHAVLKKSCFDCHSRG